MPDPKIVGNVIRKYREDRKLSQDIISSAAGIYRTHLSSIERGIRRPKLDTFIKISRAIGVPASELLDTIERESK